MNNIQDFIGAGKREKRPTGELVIGAMRLATNHDRANLKDAVWHPYPADNEYNKDGRNGYISGIVVNGSTTSRMFQYTHTRHWVGGIDHREEYAHLDKFRMDKGLPVFEQYTCG